MRASGGKRIFFSGIISRGHTKGEGCGHPSCNGLDTYSHVQSVRPDSCKAMKDQPVVESECHVYHSCHVSIRFEQKRFNEYVTAVMTCL